MPQEIKTYEYANQYNVREGDTIEFAEKDQSKRRGEVLKIWKGASEVWVTDVDGAQRLLYPERLQHISRVS